MVRIKYIFENEEMDYPMETCLFFQLLPVVFYTQSYIIHNTNKKDESLCKWNEEYPVQEI